MRVLLLAPDLYTIDKTIAAGFLDNGFEVIKYDYRSDISKVKNIINLNINKFPYKFRNVWKISFEDYINQNHISIYNKIIPEIVYIYNNENLLPETVKYFRKKSKVIIFLGDNPYYSFSSEHNLELLFHADLLISPDSYWIEQLRILGLKNILFDTLSYNMEDIKIDESNYNKKKYKSDIIFIGNTYQNSWGFKRALFLSKFCEFDIKIFGHRTWERWFDTFPVLKQKINLLNNRLETTEAKKFYSQSKLLPVDAHPGILNGIHIRFFDSISSNLLPVIEYRKDYDEIIKNVNIPVIYNYNETSNLVKRFLLNEKLYTSTLNLLKEFVLQNYSPKNSVKKILNIIRI